MTNGQASCQIDSHHQFAVVTIHHYPGQRNDEQVRQGESSLHDAQRSGAAGLLEDPGWKG